MGAVISVSLVVSHASSAAPTRFTANVAHGHSPGADGSAEVFSTPGWPTPYVYFLRTNGAPQVCQPGVPLTYQNVSVYRVGPGGTFDLDSWSGSGGLAYSLSANSGVLSSSNGSIY